MNTFFTDLSISHISNTTIHSSYNNLNEITKYKFCKDFILQDKIKKFLLNECFQQLKTLSSNNFQSSNNYSFKTKNSLISSRLIKSPIRKNCSCLDLQTINNLASKEKNPRVNDPNLKRDSLFSLKKEKKQFYLNSNKSLKLNKRRRKSLGFKSANLSHSIKKNNVNINNLEKFKNIEKKDDKKVKNIFIKPSKKQTSPLIQRKLTTNNQNEKKKINYLNVISQNISENRQTLKNPGEFYAGFFANIIEKQKSIDKKSKRNPKSFKSLNFNDKNTDNNKTDSKLENSYNVLRNYCTLSKK